MRRGADGRKTCGAGREGLNTVRSSGLTIFRRLRGEGVEEEAGEGAPSVSRSRVASYVSRVSRRPKRMCARQFGIEAGSARRLAAQGNGDVMAAWPASIRFRAARLHERAHGLIRACLRSGVEGRYRGGRLHRARDRGCANPLRRGGARGSRAPLPKRSSIAPRAARIRKRVRPLRAPRNAPISRVEYKCPSRVLRRSTGMGRPTSTSANGHRKKRLTRPMNTPVDARGRGLRDA